jgi:hypothetical protein
MTWVQIVLLILQILKQLKGSKSAESFASSVQAGGQLPSASGDFLKWLWENREQIIEFVKIIVGMFPQAPPATTLADESNPVELLRDFVNE